MNNGLTEFPLKTKEIVVVDVLDEVVVDVDVNVPIVVDVLVDVLVVEVLDLDVLVDVVVESDVVDIEVVAWNTPGTVFCTSVPTSRCLNPVSSFV